MEIAVRECAILIRPAFLVIPMRFLAAVVQVALMTIIQVDLMDIWDLALKDPDTMRVLQQNQQLALRIIILAVPMIIMTDHLRADIIQVDLMDIILREILGWHLR